MGGMVEDTCNPITGEVETDPYSVANWSNLLGRFQASERSPWETMWITRKNDTQGYSLASMCAGAHTVKHIHIKQNKRTLADAD